MDEDAADLLFYEAIKFLSLLNSLVELDTNKLLKKFEKLFTASVNKLL